MQRSLRPSTLVPRGFVVDEVSSDGAGALITVRGVSNASSCPQCGRMSERVHSRYQRHLADLPMVGKPVRLVVRARRFHCDTVVCGRRIFAERFEDNVLVPWARRTARLDHIVHHLGLALDRKTVRKYIERGLEAPVYGPRKPRQAVIDPFTAYLRERVTRYPGLTGRRLFRELKELDYGGGYTAVTDFLRDVRPAATERGYEVRFETPPGEQAQVDFAQFHVVFTDEPTVPRIVWLFSLVLGFSRLIWGRFVVHQDLPTVLRCHAAAFEALGGAPREVLYDRMKTAVIGEGDAGGIVYNRALVDLARHYGFHPRACRPYRAKTKGKVERPFRYIREDFFLARSFRNLDDLNAQLRHWLDTVANSRVHATTRRIVNEAFAEERASLRPLPLAPFRSVLKLERRISREGMVSVGGNFYSVPDATRRRVVEVHTLAEEVRIFEDGVLIAAHPVLEGRHQRQVLPGHRTVHVSPRRQRPKKDDVILHGSGDRVAQRPLAFYDAVARVMAKEQRP